MKKLIAITVIVMFSFSTAFAASNRGGGAATSVAEARNMPDNSPVTLTGKIERGLGGNKYQFRDASGIIMLEIDGEVWNGLSVGSEDDVVEISGEVDKDFSGLTVDVDRIVKK